MNELTKDTIQKCLLLINSAYDKRIENLYTIRPNDLDIRLKEHNHMRKVINDTFIALMNT